MCDVAPVIRDLFFWQEIKLEFIQEDFRRAQMLGFD